MLSITETLTVARSQHDCFCYLADLRKLVEWDPLVREARKDTPGPVGKGSCFTIKINIVGLSVPFRYVITEYKPEIAALYCVLVVFAKLPINRSSPHFRKKSARYVMCWQPSSPLTISIVSLTLMKALRPE